MKGRTEWHLSPDELQRDLDVYLDEHNLRRTHQGYRVMGRTPAQALREALGVEELPPFILQEESSDLEPSAAEPLTRRPGCRGNTVLVHSGRRRAAPFLPRERSSDPNTVRRLTPYPETPKSLLAHSAQCSSWHS